jgi:MFS family permease
MRPNFNLMRATLTGALGGLLFGFDTVVISGAIDALVKLYGLSARGEGFTVAIGLVGTVIGALGAGTAGQRLGGREALRLTALLYIISAFGCGLAWNWPAFLLFRFVGGLGIGASSVLGPCTLRNWLRPSGVDGLSAHFNLMWCSAF